MTMTSDSGSIPGADATPNDMGHTTRQTSVYVYETPVRLWHWINAAAIFVLCVTGYFIGSPPPSMQIAEATHQFVFGYIRFAHFAAGWILAIGFLGRIYWAIFGNHDWASSVTAMEELAAIGGERSGSKSSGTCFWKRRLRNTLATTHWHNWPCSPSSHWALAL